MPEITPKKPLIQQVGSGLYNIPGSIYNAALSEKTRKSWFMRVGMRSVWRGLGKLILGLPWFLVLMGKGLYNGGLKATTRPRKDNSGKREFSKLRAGMTAAVAPLLFSAYWVVDNFLTADQYNGVYITHADKREVDYVPWWKRFNGSSNASDSQSQAWQQASKEKHTYRTEYRVAGQQIGIDNGGFFGVNGLLGTGLFSSFKGININDTDQPIPNQKLYVRNVEFGIRHRIVQFSRTSDQIFKQIPGTAAICDFPTWGLEIRDPILEGTFFNRPEIADSKARCEPISDANGKRWHIALQRAQEIGRYRTIVPFMNTRLKQAEVAAPLTPASPPPAVTVQRPVPVVAKPAPVVAPAATAPATPTPTPAATAPAAPAAQQQPAAASTPAVVAPAAAVVKPAPAVQTTPGAQRPGTSAAPATAVAPK